MSFELVALKTGVWSLRSLENRETFHPVTGPQAEANILHVKQQRMVERSAEHTARGEQFVIWDVGFGAAANVLAAIEALKLTPSRVAIHSFDKTTAPLEFALQNAEALGYLRGHEKMLERLIFERTLAITPHMTIQLHLGDFRESMANAAVPAPHAMIYDPYSPVGNPEMWSLEHFSRLRSRMDDASPCLLTNYTRSTAVRVTLLLAGFYVGVGCEVGEKAETTVASNCRELIQRPLAKSWLERVHISRNSAPMTSAQYSQAYISDSDFRLLKSCPQFY